MNRRQFITLLGGAATAWPLTARAQQAAMPVIGFLNSGSPEPYRQLVATFRQGLSETSQNLAIEYRWAEGAYDRLPMLASDLVRQQVAVIFAGAPPAVLAAKAATKTIPIVFTSGGDPVELGLVSSLNRPGANVTGVSFLVNELGAKRVELLRDLVPTATLIGFLPTRIVQVLRPRRKTRKRLRRFWGCNCMCSMPAMNAKSRPHLRTLPNGVSTRSSSALTRFWPTRRDQLVALAARLAIPTMYSLREYVVAGGLMSYAPSIADVYRQAGIYTGKILKGAKAADLPVLQPTKFELVINLKTAKVLV